MFPTNARSRSEKPAVSARYEPSLSLYKLTIRVVCFPLSIFLESPPTEANFSFLNSPFMIEDFPTAL